MKSANSSRNTVGRKRSLSRRFSFALSVVVLAILLVFAAGIVLYNYYQVQKELKSQLRNTMELAETSLTTAVWQMDVNSMNDILEAILINKAIASVRIYTDNVLATSKSQPRYAGLDFAHFHNSSKFIVKSVDVKRLGEVVGKFEVAISLGEMKRELLVTIIVVITLAIILCVAILLTSMLVTRRYIFEPLVKLEGHAKMIAGGNFESTIEISGNDEFTQLATAYNFMANQLKISFDTLEQKVMERTSELLLAKNEAEKMNQHLGVVGAELQALLDNSPVGILSVNFDKIIQRVNPEITRITGYSEEELVDNSTRILFATQEIYEELDKATYPDLRKYGFCETDIEIRTKRGKLVQGHVRGRIIAAEGGIEGVVWSLEDISMRLKMEEELLKVKKLESIGVFAGGIAHDFNNLLLAIIGNISLARRIATNDEKMQELLISAQKASERAKELTVKFLTFSSGGEPVRATESLPKLLEESASFVLSGSNVKCDIECNPDLWSVSMDRAQINQVIQNLVLNADQAMPQGGIVKISCENVLIRESPVAGLDRGRYVRVIVQDQGIGIPSKNISKVFDPYFSTKNKDSNKGSGLGLAIVHSIILKHGGTITVDSASGKGSIFTIYLPATLEATSEESEVTKVVDMRGGKILVMDDEEMVRTVVCNMLLHLGYRTVEAVGGDEAIALYTHEREKGVPFDAVIMDLTIPGGKGGVETVGEIRKLDPNARVIVSSGYSNDPILDNYRTYGFCNIVTKPYELHDLSKVLEQVLEIKPAENL